MKPEFCTLFDSNYLPRGLALHASLTKVEPEAQLRAFCMDERTYEVLEKLDLPGLTAVPLAELERHDPELAAVKRDRTQVEYCWTATPCIARYCLTFEPRIEAITYVDADIYFFSAPEPLFAELGEDSTQIVPHRYAPEHRHFEETSGTFNVEWLTFRRDEHGLEALEWWRERCIEWCYYRLEDGKLGDQKYLDDWPARFEGVTVLEHVGGGLAPWNVANYRLRHQDDQVWVDDVPLVFFHFHSLRLFRPSASYLSGRITSELRTAPSGSLLWTSAYPRSPEEERLVWEPYLAAIEEALKLIRTVDPRFTGGFVTTRELARQSLRSSLARTRHRASRLHARLRSQQK